MTVVHVVPLDLADDHRGRQVLAIQREACVVEAAMIGSDGTPALTESREEMRAGGERWLGAIEGGTLAGAVAWHVFDDGTLDICRLVVAPRAFRQGVATALLTSSTGAALACP